MIDRRMRIPAYGLVSAREQYLEVDIGEKWGELHMILRGYDRPAECDVKQLERQAAEGRELMKEMTWNS